MSHSLEKITEANFEVVKQYIHSGASVSLSQEQQEMVDKCLEAYGLLKKYPQRNVCIRQFMVTNKCAYNTAAKYVDFARANWASYVDVKREFLETFFLDRLLSEISDPNASESVRSKNLATLQKYLEHMPEQKIDPRIMESNNLFIQVNINGRVVNLSEKILEALPVDVRNDMMAALQGDIEEAEAIELLDS